jgi:hypothetical protein
VVASPPPYHLGKAPARVDPRTLRLADYLEPGIPTPPSSVDNSQRVGAWQVLGNDQYGDCVMAAHAHNLMLWAAMAGVQFSVTAQEVVQEYMVLTHGYDSGLVVLDTLNFLRKNFWKGKEILGFASVDPRNQTYMQHAISMFGSLYRGVLLPQTAQSQVGGTWDVVNAPGNAPGSWGGHAIIDVGYDPTYTKTITWGLIQRATYRFWNAYCDEAYVIIPTEKIPGFDQDAFIRDLQSIGQYVGPAPSPAPPSPVPPTPPAPPSPPQPPAPVADYVTTASVVLTYKSGRKVSGSIGFSS